MEHRYDNLLKEIIGIIRNDYAGFEEVKNRHDSRYFVNTAGTAWKRGTLDEILFLRIVSQYLASLGDPCLKFSMLDHGDYKNYDVGFRARRSGEYLYVTESDAENRLVPGDRITALNSLAPGRHRTKFTKNILVGETPEREQWGGLLKMVRHVGVQHADGSKEDLPLRHYLPRPVSPAPDFSAPRPDVCLIRIEQFSADTQALEQLLVQHESELNTCEKLIIDIRKNAGGSDGGFFPLLPYVMDRPFTPEELLDADPVRNNYSKGNCERRIQEFTALRAQYAQQEDGGEAVSILDGLIQEFRQKSGTGWEEVNAAVRDGSEPAAAAPDPGETDRDAAPAESKAAGTRMQPKENIQSVILITDTWCRDSGEVFADIARRSSKVRLLGRPTMGTIDYTNYVTAVFDDTYVLSYPMGKKARIANGERYNLTGLPVDIYRPWTPAECTRDILTEKALEYI